MYVPKNARDDDEMPFGIDGIVEAARRLVTAATTPRCGYVWKLPNLRPTLDGRPNVNHYRVECSLAAGHAGDHYSHAHEMTVPRV